MDAEPVKKTTGKRFDGTPGPGRPKGVPNKVTTLAKTAIADAAAGLGGTKRLIAWCKEDEANERVFWSTIYPKLIPLDVNANVRGEHTVTHRAEELSEVVGWLEAASAAPQRITH